jgi:hypothetical protein
VQDTLKILHSYKVYRPGIDGGIPFAIAALSGPSTRSQIPFLWHDVAERASLGYVLFNTARAYLSSDAAPSCTDGRYSRLPPSLSWTSYPASCRTMRTYRLWYAAIVGYTWLKSLVTPAIRRTLQRAKSIVGSDRSVLENSPLLAPLVEKRGRPLRRRCGFRE